MKIKSIQHGSITTEKQAKKGTWISEIGFDKNKSIIISRGYNTTQLVLTRYPFWLPILYFSENSENTVVAEILLNEEYSTDSSVTQVNFDVIEFE